MPALDAVSLAIPRHCCTAITGPSGSGKSTLFNLLAGLDRPDEGAVRVDGTELTALSDTALARWRARTVGYVVLGHKASTGGASGGVERLGAAMAIALVILMPIGLREAVGAFDSATLILAGVGVGLCSSVIPYVCDQLAMSRLPRASFALMLAILPATATIIGTIVLAQIPTLTDLVGIALVMAGVAVHQPVETS